MVIYLIKFAAPTILGLEGIRRSSSSTTLQYL